ncbi:hypothetical protein ACP4OV_031204 [Aristida adscensionis]
MPARKRCLRCSAIPPLVAMLDSDSGWEEITASRDVRAAQPGYWNKAAIVQAGALHKMLRIPDGGAASRALTEAVSNLLCLSVLDAKKPVIGTSGAAPCLVRGFEEASTEQARHDVLHTLQNLSIAAGNVPHLQDAGLAAVLMAAVGDASMTDYALAALCNLVAACPEGHRAVSP